MNNITEVLDYLENKLGLLVLDDKNDSEIIDKDYPGYKWVVVCKPLKNDNDLIIYANEIKKGSKIFIVVNIENGLLKNVITTYDLTIALKEAYKIAEDLNEPEFDNLSIWNNKEECIWHYNLD